MLLYMGGGAALADYYRRRRALILTDCAASCDELSRLGSERLGALGGDRATFACALVAAEDCRALCTLAASLMTRGSELAGCVLAACAESCRRCAGACGGLSNEEVAARCMLSCRRAEEACRQAGAGLAA
jgi:hypothetical protein